MRDEIQKDDNRRDGGPGSRKAGHFNTVNEEGDGEDDGDDDGDDADKYDEPGVKVAGWPRNYYFFDLFYYSGFPYKKEM